MHKSFNELNTLLSEVSELHTASLDESAPEEVTDELYTQYWEKAQEASRIVMALIDIDENTALKMVIHRRNDISALLARAI